MIRPQAAEGKSPAAPESTTDHSLHHAGVALLSHWECGGRAAPPLPPSRACRTMRAAHSRGPRPAPPLVIPAFAGIQGGRAAGGYPAHPVLPSTPSAILPLPQQNICPTLSPTHQPKKGGHFAAGRPSTPRTCCPSARRCAAPVPVSRGDAMQAAVQGEDAGYALRVLPKGGDGERGANPSRCSVMRARCSTGPRPCQRAAPVPVSRGDAMQAAVQGEDAGLTLRVLPKGGDGECGANPSRSSVMRTGCSAGVAQAPDLGRCGSRPRYTHQTQNTRLRTHLRKVVQLQPAHRRTPAASKQGRNHQPSKQSPSSALVSFESAQKKAADNQPKENNQAACRRQLRWRPLHNRHSRTSPAPTHPHKAVAPAAAGGIPALTEARRLLECPLRGRV